MTFNNCQVIEKMGVIKYIHHIELMTKSFSYIYDYLTHSFGFQTVATYNNKLVLRSGSATFIIQSSLDYNSISVDTVYDVALEVENIDIIIDIARKNSVEILSYPETIEDKNGYVTTAKIRSCVGNVIHTLICHKSHNGIFLPKYEIVEAQQNENSHVECFDHITFAVDSGSSDLIIKWYYDIFGTMRFKINSDDSMAEGFVVKHNSRGMRLKALDYWKCSEVGINNKDASCKFVIAEELNDQVPNQIGTFLREHGGPGIQHIGLQVKSIKSSVRTLQFNGVEFLQPPKQYYEMLQLRMFGDDNFSVSDLEKCGILIDFETCSDSEKIKYLMQAFTKPIFDKDTFFLELIERRGATGFGAGNIKALWDAVDASLSLNADGN